MRNTIVEGLAVSQSGRTFPEIEKRQPNEAISILIPFARVKHLLSQYPAPKRPSRKQPIHNEDAVLLDELAAWDAASDEALESMEDESSGQSQ
jgi:hypothetical protein